MQRIADRQPRADALCEMGGAEPEDTKSKRLGWVLAGLVRSVEQDSPVLQTPEHLLFLFTDRAPTLLKRHLSGWCR